jgi:hypothetical protein
MRLACANEGASMATDIKAAIAVVVRIEKLTGSSFKKMARRAVNG